MMKDVGTGPLQLVREEGAQHLRREHPKELVLIKSLVSIKLERVTL